MLLEVNGSELPTVTVIQSKAFKSLCVKNTSLTVLATDFHLEEQERCCADMTHSTLLVHAYPTL